MDKQSTNKYSVVIGIALIVGVIIGIANPNEKYFRFEGNRKIEVSKQEYDEVMVPANPSVYNGDNRYADIMRNAEYEREEKAKSYQKETSTNFGALIMACLGVLGLGLIIVNTSTNKINESDNTPDIIAEEETTQEVEDEASEIMTHTTDHMTIETPVIKVNEKIGKPNLGLRKFVAWCIIITGVMNLLSGIFRINSDQNRGGGFVLFGLFVILFGAFFYYRFVTIKDE